MNNEKTAFHFSGICGAGMGSVAMLMAEAGYQVKGNDEKAFPPMSTELQKRGIFVSEGFGKESLLKGFSPTIQVLANRFSKDSEETIAGKELGLEVMSFPEVLENYILPERIPYVVAGTHGKTTTAFAMAHMFSELEGGWFVGGVPCSGLGSAHLGKCNKPFVLEGDEYDCAWFDKKSKFLHYRPQHVLLTHLEMDHVDIFADFEAVKKAFKELLPLVPQNGLVVYCFDAPHLKELMKTYSGSSLSWGYQEGADIRIVNAEKKEGSDLFRVELLWKNEIVSFETPLFGDLYHSNLAGAYILARETGLDNQALLRGLRKFNGVQRRMEKLDCRHGFLAFNDFAHHPTAVACTIGAVKKAFPDKKVSVAFDPRNATSRRNYFQKEFAKAFLLADRVLLGPPFADARLKKEETLDTQALASSLGEQAFACTSADELIKRALDTPKDSILILMSCGAFYNLAQLLCCEKA